MELNPTLDEVADVKTAVSEAVTNAIIHGYDDPEKRYVLRAPYMATGLRLSCQIRGRALRM